jgi:protein required for attachment to host cells
LARSATNNCSRRGDISVAKAQAFALILVAHPGSLGEIRQHLHQEVSEKLVGEIAKDLTNHPIDEIARIIRAA